jgi:hypothetical protein
MSCVFLFHMPLAKQEFRADLRAGIAAYFVNYTEILFKFVSHFIMMLLVQEVQDSRGPQL